MPRRRSFVDERVLTDERLPIQKVVSNAVTGWSMSADGLLGVVTKAVGAETMLAKSPSTAR
jgi:cation transport ATPase